MISLDYPTYDLVQKVLAESPHPEARTAAKRLTLAALEMIERDLEFNNEAPALCRRQAG